MSTIDFVMVEYTYLLFRLSKMPRPFISLSSLACFSVKDYRNVHKFLLVECNASSCQYIKPNTCFVDSMLRGDIYCVLTSHATPLSVGLSFLFMPSFLIGVAASSSRNSSSSSGARGCLPLGGLYKKVHHTFSVRIIHSFKYSNLQKEQRTVLVNTEIKQVQRYP